MHYLKPGRLHHPSLNLPPLHLHHLPPPSIPATSTTAPSSTTVPKQKLHQRKAISNNRGVGCFIMKFNTSV